MTTSNNVENLKTMQFKVAKRWRAISISCGAGVLILGLVVLFANQASILLALAAAALVGVSEYYKWKSDNIKGAAEALLRRFELHDSLGWAISQREIRDMLADGPDSVKAAVDSPEVRTYFASGSGVGLLRMMENLEESSFWSKHLAKEMAKWVFLVAVLIIALALTILVLAFQYTATQGGSGRIGQVIISILVFLFSDGYLRLAFDYRAFADKANDIELLAIEMQKRSAIGESEAILLLQDYQLARSLSPLIPDKIYELRESKLNDLWARRNAVV